MITQDVVDKWRQELKNWKTLKPEYGTVVDAPSTEWVLPKWPSVRYDTHLKDIKKMKCNSAYVVYRARASISKEAYELAKVKRIKIYDLSTTRSVNKICGHIFSEVILSSDRYDWPALDVHKEEIIKVLQTRVRLIDNPRFIVDKENKADKVEKLKQNEEVNNMTKAQRNIQNFTLIDNDAGLNVQDSVVFSADYVVESGDIDSTKMQIVMDEDIKGLIKKHNEKRTKQIDQDILNRTGQEVKLRAVELKDLTWIVK